MRYWIFSVLFLAVLYLVACKEKDALPQGILPKNRMISILIDVHIAEAMVMEKNYQSSDSAQATFQALQRKILKVHKVDSVYYHKSYAHYLQDMVLLDEVYTSVVDSLAYKAAVGKLQLKF